MDPVGSANHVVPRIVMQGPKPGIRQHTNTGLSNNRLGALLMIAGMATAVVADALFKIVSSDVGTNRMMVLTGLSIAATSVLCSRLESRRMIGISLMNGKVLWRTVFEVAGIVMTMVALARASLSDVAAALQCVPFFVTLGGILVLKERSSVMIWGAVIVGLVGMGLIVRPVFSGLDTGLLAASAAALLLACRDLANRVIPRRISTCQLGVMSGFALAGLGAGSIALVPQSTAAHSPSVLAIALASALFSAVTFFLVTTASRIAEATILAPFRFSRSIFGFALGLMLFQETIGYRSLIGFLAIIVGGALSWFAMQQKT